MESPIREMRKQLSMSEGKFAVGLGVSQATLSSIENGLTDIPAAMRRSLRSLNVDVKEVVRLQRTFMACTKGAIREEIRAKLSA